MTTHKHLLVLLFGLSLLISFPGLSQKTDRILLDNNDWITGEIKKLDYGKLSYKTDAAGTIQIKWDRIYQIKSDKYFEIGLGRGIMYYGSIDISTDDKKYIILVITEEEALEIDMNRIVEITPIKNKFWAKMDGNIDIGYSFNKGSQVSNWNGSFRLDYRPANSLTTISANSIFTEQPERDDTKKQDLSLSYKYITNKNIAYTGFSSIQQNSELGLQLRASVGGGISKNWFRSNVQRFITTLGVIANREQASDNNQFTTNYEGLIRTEYKVFRYRDPEIDVTSYFDFYPSFTVKDRYRTELDIKVKLEVFKDFYVGFTFYHNLDTKPPAETSNSTSDYGINTTVGYSF